jgi:hypothetical protein
MADKRNFLLGKGERLTEPVTAAGRPLTKVPPYSVEEARNRLTPMFEETVASFAKIPDQAKPAGQVVASLVLNPEYTAKSYYPTASLRKYGLRAVGSKAISIMPEKRSQGRVPSERPTTELYVAGEEVAFENFLDDLDENNLSDKVQVELTSIEKFSALKPEAKLKGEIRGKIAPIEVVLHASEFRSDAFIIQAFQEYANMFGVEPDLEHRFHAGGLCFLRMRASHANIENLAQFSFLRAVREMPRLRTFPAVRALPSRGRPVILPSLPALDSSLRVAIFDGGVPDISVLEPWVTAFDPPGIGPAVPDLVEHGYAVTSAVLFGHLVPGKEATQPFANVDHIRVLDQNSGADPLELYDVLERIKNTLDSSAQYDFINLSLGPQLPIEDDDVHAWTAVLDEYLADGKCLATVAVGNDGDADATQGLNRIQVPADSVNALSIGSCGAYGTPWLRAEYSSVGPGRTPGLVKPDLVGFGGSDSEPYRVLNPNTGLQPYSIYGTSFAAPHILRIGAGVMATFGGNLDPLAVKALLIHTAIEGSEPQSEIGWGRNRDEVDEIGVCPPGVVRVVYQGELTASKYLRAEIPLPDEVLRGMVEVTATCCFTTDVDPAHPSNYTRSGIEITFRPSASTYVAGALHPKSEAFFSQSKLLQTEDELRSDAHKWETSLHSKRRKRGSSFDNPVFDIHYMSRDEGRPDNAVGKINYALVVTVEAPRHADLYDLIVRKYRNVLEPMVPIQIPLTV